MISKYLNLKGEAAIESVSTMALMLGEDPTTACESDEAAKGTGARFMEGVKKALAKIKEWAQRFINWLRSVFYNFIKTDKFEVDRKEWADGEAVITKCGNINISKLNSALASVHHGEMSSEQHTKLTDMHEDILFSISSVKNSTEYKNFIKNEYENLNTIWVKGSDLGDVKTRLDKTADEISNEIRRINNLPDEIQTDPTIHLSLGLLRAMVSIVSIHMTVLNRFVAAATRREIKHSKDK